LRTNAFQRRRACEEPHELHAWFGKSPAQTLNKKECARKQHKRATKKKVVSDETMEKKNRWQGTSGFRGGRVSRAHREEVRFGSRVLDRDGVRIGRSAS